MGLNMQEIEYGDHPWGEMEKEQGEMGEPSDHDAGFTPVEERRRKFAKQKSLIAVQFEESFSTADGQSVDQSHWWEESHIS